MAFFVEFVANSDCGEPRTVDKRQRRMTSSVIVRAIGAFLIVVGSACASDEAIRSTDSESTDDTVSTTSSTTSEESAPATSVTVETEPTTTIAPPETTAPPETSDTTDTAGTTGPIDTTTSEPTRVVPVVGTVIGIEYYGACGNETFDLDGVTWYPLPLDEQEQIDVGNYEAVEATLEPSGLVRVAPPGPGDDVGTLFTFEDGLGRFVSDSGLIDLWMTTKEQTYDFEC